MTAKLLTTEEKIAAIKAKLGKLGSEWESADPDDRFWIEQEIDSFEALLRQTERSLNVAGLSRK